MSKPSERPVIRLRTRMSRRLRAGHPWVFSNEVEMDRAARLLDPGCLVALRDAGGEVLGVATFNPHSLIAARLLDRSADAVIDAAWLRSRLEPALALRERLFDRPCYRLVHSEADGLPGLVIDRYGEALAVQFNTAGMAALEVPVLAALDSLLRPTVVVSRGDSPARTLEGLAREVRIMVGRLDGPVRIEENGLVFLADIETGQKTGWFFDQRDNRAFSARLAKGRRVLDVFSHSGGFGLTAGALGPATEVVMVERSEPALDLARAAADLNGIAGKCRFHRGEAFTEMERLADAGERFGLVIADPPAFVKSKKDLGAGARGYRKMTRLAAALVEPGGALTVASCSHHMSADSFLEQAVKGLAAAGRSARLVRAAGAGPDHPVHPALPESAYLKCLTFILA